MVLWDADASLLAFTEISTSRSQWIAQYHLASKAIHRFDALSHLKAEFPDYKDAKAVLEEAIHDPFWGIRQLALEAFLDLDSSTQKRNLPAIIKLASSDPKPFVRTQAWKVLASHRFEGKQAMLEKAMMDSSISVSTQGYKVYLKEDYPDAPAKIAALQTSEDLNYSGVLSDYYSSRPGQTSFDWYMSTLKKPGNPDNYELIQGFGSMLKQVKDSALVKKGIEQLYSIGMEGKKAEMVIGSFQVLKNFQAWPDVRQKRLKILEAHQYSDFAEVLEYLKD
jgi:aminopeptidase N